MNVPVLNMARNLDDNDLAAFINFGAPHLVDLLIEKASAPFHYGKQWLYSSYHFLCMIRKYSGNHLMHTVGQEKMLRLTSVLCDRLLAESTKNMCV